MQRIAVSLAIEQGARLQNRRAQKRPLFRVAFSDVWLREPDLNRRPSGYEPDELPDCSIPRLCGGILQRFASVSTVDPDKFVEVQALSVFSRRAAGAQGKWRKAFSSIAR
jgi:hypothetical protein